MTTERYSINVKRRLAAVARDRSPEALAEREVRGALPVHIDELCWAWSQWCDTRRYYGPPPALPSVLGRLAQRSRTTCGDGPDARNSAQLAALHLAIIGQPVDALDRCVFEAHYRYRPRSIKAAAALFEISRKHWYTLRNNFARRVYAVHTNILAAQSCDESAPKLSPLQVTTL